LFSKIVFSRIKVAKIGEKELSPGLENQNVVNNAKEKLNRKIFTILFSTIRDTSKDIKNDKKK
tara:strand:+ start:800 stop:988 length:189 start_codon:yes stop_codon:yes gene_type:complete